MRDPQMLVDLLRQMDKEPSGRILSLEEHGMSDGDQSERHHLEILADAGLVEWLSEHMARITNDGYDFLNAVDNPQTGKEYMAKFVDLLGKGTTFINAVKAVVGGIMTG